MTNAQKSRLAGLAGVFIGGVGLGFALHTGNRWTIAVCSFIYGATVTLVYVGRALLRLKR